MSVRVATCKFINDMRKENDERLRGTEKDSKTEREGGREQQIESLYLRQPV